MEATLNADVTHSDTASSRPQVVLLTYMDVPASVAEEFGEWYEGEHVPERLSVEGFRAAQRYEAMEGHPRYLTMYDVDNLEVFTDKRYVALRTAVVTPWTERMRRYFFNDQFVRAVYIRTNPQQHAQFPTSDVTRRSLLIHRFDPGSISSPAYAEIVAEATAGADHVRVREFALHEQQHAIVEGDGGGPRVTLQAANDVSSLGAMVVVEVIGDAQILLNLKRATAEWTRGSGGTTGELRVFKGVSATPDGLGTVDDPASGSAS